MNTLKFEIQEDNIVNILIDWKNLIDMIKVYEKPFAKKERNTKLAWRYWWINKDILFRDLNWEWWDRRQILWCECGIIDCWPMEMDIIKDNTIIW